MQDHLVGNMVFLIKTAQNRWIGKIMNFEGTAIREITTAVEVRHTLRRIMHEILQYGRL